MTRRSSIIATLLMLSALSVSHLQAQHPEPQTSHLLSSSSRIADTHALIQQMVNAVSSSNLMANIQALQDFGTRYEYDPGREAAADWIVKELEWWGSKAESEWYKFSGSIFRDVEMIDKNVGYVVGANVLGTTDGGASWGFRTIHNWPGVSCFLNGIDFPTPLTGWVVGTNGLVMKSTDGGTSWTARILSPSYQMYDVEFANENLGIIIGAAGTILRTSDGGSSWIEVNSGSQNSLLQIKVVDSLNMWTVGSYGTILRSSDGGLSWTNQTSGVSDVLYGVDFINSRLGWAVGSGPRLLKTTNGGANWSIERIDYESWEYSPVYFAVCFADSLHGWVTDRYGGVWKTTDAGQSWQRTNPANRYGWKYYPRIKAFQDNHLIICGGNPNILLSTDGGLSWTSQTSNFPSAFLHTSRNIVVTIVGKLSPEKEYVMVAHYDSVLDGPGADDNASGTSAVMEAARILKNYQFESTIKLVAVSAEEFGMYGSEEYVAQAKNEGRNLIGIVNGDMIAYPLKGDTTRLVLGSFVARNWMVDSALVYNQRYGIGATLDPFIDSTGASDYGPFAMAGYSSLDVGEGTPQEIWGGGNPYYHKPTDTIDKLHPGLMRRAAQLMLATIAELARPIGGVPEEEIPATFVLEQNFPNPFNAGTTIRFKIPQSSPVSLKVFNVLGEEMATLVNDRLEAGAYSVRWEPRLVSSGIFFYHLSAGSSAQTRKAMLLK